MKTALYSAVLVNLVFHIYCLSIGKSTDVVHNSSELDRDSPLPRGVPSSDSDNCDISSIPAMDNFDMDKFSGTWYELAKTFSNNIDVDDGMWKIMVNNASNERYKFLFSGRDANSHCIRPILGLIHTEDKNPGEIHFKYRTYSTAVEETFRVLYTDYDNFAALYTCVAVNEHTQKCHPAGVYASIWTRKSHVQHDVFDRAAEKLEKACIEKNTLRIRLLKSPCKVDDLGIRDDMIPAPNICYLPVSPGSCKAEITRYYFNEYENNCHEFHFSGCGGNNNNFLTKGECANMCMELSSQDTICRETSVCALACPPCCREVSDGCVKCSCETVIVDHFANCIRDENQCLEGCDAEERSPGCFVCICEDKYPVAPDDHVSPICLEVKDKGKCTAREERFYYNVLAQRCEKFNYTGCGGTKNNFVSLEQCQTECKVPGVQAANIPLPHPVPDGGHRVSSCYMSFLCVLFSVLWLR